jgi:hypothetical protein
MNQPPPTGPDPPAPEEGATLPHLPPASPQPATLPPAPGQAAPTAPPPGDPPARETPSLTPPTVPGYQILGELGRGGMGVVYKARQVRLNRVVALKMILAGGHAGPADLARFRAEAEAIARLQHPNIVQIHEIGEHDGRPFFSLEFCAGGSLAQRLNGTPLPPREAAQVVETLARAVQAAHDRGVIHRDLKPANVLLSAEGGPPGAEGDDSRAAGPLGGILKITDFGLAKKLDEAGQTASGTVLGTPSYMAPEQAGGKGKQAGPAADIYALGAILYELLTGRPPFKAATPLETILQVLSEEPVPPRQLQSRTPRSLETVCLKCLAKDPRQRYATARDLAADLRRYLQGEPIRARRPGLLTYCWYWLRHPARVANAGVILLLLALIKVPFLVTQFPRVFHDRSPWEVIAYLLGHGITLPPHPLLSRVFLTEAALIPLQALIGYRTLFQKRWAVWAGFLMGLAVTSVSLFWWASSFGEFIEPAARPGVQRGVPAQHPEVRDFPWLLLFTYNGSIVVVYGVALLAWFANRGAISKGSHGGAPSSFSR